MSRHPAKTAHPSRRHGSAEQSRREPGERQQEGERWPGLLEQTDDDFDDFDWRELERRRWLEREQEGDPWNGWPF